MLSSLNHILYVPIEKPEVDDVFIIRLKGNCGTVYEVDGEAIKYKSCCGFAYTLKFDFEEVPCGTYKSKIYHNGNKVHKVNIII